MKKILVVTLMLAMIASNCLAALNNNSYASQNKKSQRQVMHDFMQTLDKSTAKNWLNALDEATNKASEGKFQTLAIAVNSFINDYNKNIRDSDGNITDDSAREFLLKCCGIDLSNEDVGAIIGKDARESLIELTAESIIPENVENIIYLDKLWNESPVSLSKINELDDVIAFRTPMSTLKFNKRGVDVVVANYEILDKKDKIIINGLYNWWIDGALDLIEKSYGLKFSNSDVHQIIYIDSFKIFSAILGISLSEKTLAAAKKNGNNLILYVNKKYFDDNFEIKLNSSGKFEKQFFDRTIAHELTHLIMAAKMKTYDDFPLFIKEGLAELTIGADDHRNLIKLLKNPERLYNSFYNENKSMDDDVYCAGYMFFRYFAKQVAGSENITTNQPMTFSQPINTGFSLMFSQAGGGIFIRNATENNGDFYSRVYKGKKIIYDGSGQNKSILYGKGIAKYGSGYDALYAHYNAYNIRNDAYIHFGDKNINNTIPISAFIFGEEIFKIDTDSGITFYMIHTSYDLPDETWWTLIGRRKDGVWVKYFDTDSITVKYFGESARAGYANVWQGKSICCDNFHVNGNTIVIEYSRYHKNAGQRGNLVKEGEFRFKWDDAAQWFGVEHIVY